MSVTLTEVLFIHWLNSDCFSGFLKIESKEPSINIAWYAKKWNAKPFRRPEMPNLPNYRIQPSHPFQSVGVDLFGPINIKSQNFTEKKWIILFTYL